MPVLNLPPPSLLQAGGSAAGWTPSEQARLLAELVAASRGQDSLQVWLGALGAIQRWPQVCAAVSAMLLGCLPYNKKR